MHGAMRYLRRCGSGRAGFTLFELMVAVLLLGMISTMIYSVLNTSIRFTQRGEEKIIQVARQQGLLSLLHRQIRSAWYDERKNNVAISSGDNILRLVTRYPLYYRYAGVVLVFYRYEPYEQKLYYTEKRDYYNIDYNDDYVPELEEMMLLSENIRDLSFVVDEESLDVTIEYGGESHIFTAKCVNPFVAD